MKVIGFVLTVLLSFLGASLILDAVAPPRGELQAAMFAAPASETPTTPPPAAGIPPEQAMFLIRLALTTLESANRSGNYAPLRELASPEFQRRNSADALAGIFGHLQKQGLDLRPAASAAPQLSSPLTPDGRGVLRLVGRFEAIRPAVAFDLTYLPIDGHWRLDAISVAMLPPQT